MITEIQQYLFFPEVVIIKICKEQKIVKYGGCCLHSLS
jgi:hypothetical protein